jgi:hypothetical protein
MNSKLAHIDTPVLVLQADGDQVVDPASANMIARRLTGTQNKTVKMLPADRHGILNENLAGTVDLVMDFVAKADKADLPVSDSLSNRADRATSPAAPIETIRRVEPTPPATADSPETAQAARAHDTHDTAVATLSARDKSRAILARAGFGKLGTKKHTEPKQTVPTESVEKPTNLNPVQPE